MEATIVEPKIERTFESLGIEKDVAIGIDGLMGNFSNKPGSHKGSWAYMLKNQLQNLGYDAEVIHNKEAWSEYDVILIDWGMEFRGTFNVFGGASDDVYYRLKQFLDYDGIIVSVHIPPPDIGAFVRGRLKTGTDLFKTLNPEDFDLKVSRMSESWFDHVFSSEKVCAGDSHILSAYKPGSMIFRNDGLTLHGALKHGLKNLVPKGTKELTVYFGNIDIRHHLNRFEFPDQKLKELITDYVQQLHELQDEGVESITVMGLLPIEFEKRRLPKTGYYKGEPFAGSREQRTYLQKLFNDAMTQKCHDNNWTFIKWPKAWEDMDPQVYAETCMESRQSVHLNRLHYMYDFDTNRKRF